MSDPETPEERLARAEARLAAITREQAELRAQVESLRRTVLHAEGRSAGPLPSLPSGRPGHSTPAEKIALFRSLFRGREDVFARLWVNEKKGSKGYAPACSHEWVRGVCDKPRVKCGECPEQAFLPVDDRVIRDHLQGLHVVGIYPMLEDETCWFVAVDFDKAGWREDVVAFVQTCAAVELPAVVERSRSGNGAHVWFFFEAPIAAVMARRMACSLLTETMARRHQLRMTSYDRLFPNQDTMPRGGFGNLIALPLQGKARQSGNTIFLDERLEAILDPWALLASKPRIAECRVQDLARAASSRGQVIGVRMANSSDDEGQEPWLRSPSPRTATDWTIADPLPDRVRAVLAQQVFIEKAGLPSQLLNLMKRLAAFQNPEFYKKQGMRLSTALTPRVISCAEDMDQHLGLPRGCLSDLQKLLSDLGVTLDLEDKRLDGDVLDLHFHGELGTIQQKAISKLSKHETGVLVAPPGSGKTVMGIHQIAMRGRSTLVLVHRSQLLDQWRAQLSVFLGLEPGDIGQVGGGKRKVTGRLDVAMIQSLVKRDEVDDIVASYGHVVVDECHHVPAVSFERVMREVRARYVTGLTATPQRRDGHHPILEFQLGAVRHRIAAQSQAAVNRFRHRLIVRDTSWRPEDDGNDLKIQDLYRGLAGDQGRNECIINDVLQALEQGRSPIVLTERRDHLEYLESRLRVSVRNLVVLRGGMGVKQRKKIREQLETIPDEDERLLLATGRFVGEGFDDARLDTLFLTMPVSWKGTLVQYAGRLQRRHPAKVEVRIFDYVDRKVPMLARMFTKRLAGYRAMGYELAEEPSSGSAPTAGYSIEYDREALDDGEN